MEQLRDYICEHVPETAPDSPSRILRQLRLKELVDYKVLNRRDSLYQVFFVEGD